MDFPKILPELETLLPPLSEVEFNQLEQNCLDAGKCPEDIVVWKEQGCVVDGHTRLKICKKHSLKFGIKKESFKDMNEVVSYMYRKALGRRNLTGHTSRVMTAKLQELQKEIVEKEENEKAELPASKDAQPKKKKSSKKGSKDSQEPKPRSKRGKMDKSVAATAKMTGMSERQVYRNVAYTEMFNKLAAPVKDVISSGMIKASDTDIKRLGTIPKVDQVRLIAKVKKGKYKTIKLGIDAYEARTAPGKKRVTKKPKSKSGGLSSNKRSRIETEVDEAFTILSRAIDRYHEVNPHESMKRRANNHARAFFDTFTEWMKNK